MSKERRKKREKRLLSGMVKWFTTGEGNECGVRSPNRYSCTMRVGHEDWHIATSCMWLDTVANRGMLHHSMRFVALAWWPNTGRGPGVAGVTGTEGLGADADWFIRQHVPAFQMVMPAQDGRFEERDEEPNEGDDDDQDDVL